MENLQVTFFVGDVIENKVYASMSLKVSGLATTEPEAQKSALTKLNPKSEKLQDFLKGAKLKISSYYHELHVADSIRTSKELSDAQKAESEKAVTKARTQSKKSVAKKGGAVKKKVNSKATTKVRQKKPVSKREAAINDIISGW